jgi:hypothetical protein
VTRFNGVLTLFDLAHSDPQNLVCPHDEICGWSQTLSGKGEKHGWVNGATSSSQDKSIRQYQADITWWTETHCLKDQDCDPTRRMTSDRISQRGMWWWDRPSMPQPDTVPCLSCEPTYGKEVTLRPGVMQTHFTSLSRAGSTTACKRHPSQGGWLRRRLRKLRP